MTHDATQDRGAQAHVIFQRCWEHLLGIEGAYSNHAADPGGETMYGVTEWLARKYGYVGPMRELPIGKARSIAKLEFWDPMSLDSVAWQSEAVARELLEAGYHMGPSNAARMLQRALNAFGDGTLGLDGDIGPKSLQALLVHLRKRGPEGERLLVTVLNALQCTAYVERVEADRRKAAFFYGWVRKRVRV